LQESVDKYGYSGTHSSIMVRRSLDAEAAVRPETALYEVLNGHSLVAALKNLQARGVLNADATYPVTVLKPKFWIFQCFNTPSGHTHDDVDRDHSV
jgi:hypothetical protein